MVMRLLLSFMFAIAAFAPARAVDTGSGDPILAAASDLAGTVMFVNSGAPGMVLVIVRDDHSVVLGYGETGKGNKRAPDGNSVFLWICVE
jgi:serine-type D-Ala-D-Ala carboxypeptidase/endopeptidase